MTQNRRYEQTASYIRRAGVHEAGVLDARELIRYATLAASSHNSQPWKFRVDKSSITILPDFTRRCPVVDPDDSHLFRSLGCAAENLVLAAGAQGFRSEVCFDPEESAVIVRFSHDASACPGELFYAITSRQCTKIPYDGSPLSETELAILVDAGTWQSGRVIMLISEDEKGKVTDYVTRGNVSQLSDHAFRDELISWIRFNPQEAIDSGDGLSGRTTYQPPLPRWLARLIINWVLTPRGQARRDAHNVKSSAGVAVFVSKRNDRQAWVEAGRAYQHFALQAAVLNIRTAFINQPLEVRSLRPEFELWLGLEQEHAQLMVRFGRGPVTPFSLRRPVDEVMIAK